MVRQLAAPQHRLLLFLQQSSVEWCSSLWLDVVKSIDPTLQRSIVVVSKFDNRLKVCVVLPLHGELSSVNAVSLLFMMFQNVYLRLRLSVTT